MYKKDSLLSRIRISFQELIIRMLAEIHINTCQLVPNAWKTIISFIVLCIKNDFLIGVVVLRRFFAF